MCFKLFIKLFNRVGMYEYLSALSHILVTAVVCRKVVVSSVMRWCKIFLRINGAAVFRIQQEDERMSLK